MVARIYCPILQLVILTSARLYSLLGSSKRCQMNPVLRLLLGSEFSHSLFHLLTPHFSYLEFPRKSPVGGLLFYMTLPELLNHISTLVSLHHCLSSHLGYQSYFFLNYNSAQSFLNSPVLPFSHEGGAQTGLLCPTKTDPRLPLIPGVQLLPRAPQKGHLRCLFFQGLEVQ